MEYTKNYSLNKPSENDDYDIAHFNDNAEAIDQGLKKLRDLVNEAATAKDVGATVDLSTAVKTSIVEAINEVALSLGNKTRTATVVVAASNASDKSKAGADYVCTGVGDGVVIQKAVDECYNRGGGLVFLAEGTFNTFNKTTCKIETITLKDNVSLVGCGQGVTVIRAYCDMETAAKAGTWIYLSTPMFKASGKNLMVQDFSWSAMLTEDEGRNGGFDWQIAQLTGWNITANRVDFMYDPPIDGDGSYNWQSNFSPVVISGGGYISLSGCNMGGANSGKWLEMQNCKDLTIDKCRIAGGWWGTISLISVTNALIRGCFIDDHDGHGWETTFTNNKGVVITDCTIMANGSDECACSGNTDFFIVNNLASQVLMFRDAGIKLNRDGSTNNWNWIVGRIV